mgnify:CR=1 FL=1
MGIGDEVMCAGEAARLAAGTSRRYMMLDKNRNPKWHFVWDGNPNVARPGHQHDGVVAYGSNGRRVYIEDETTDRRKFREYHPYPATLVLPPNVAKLTEQARGKIIFNPSIKDRASPGKRWPLQSWKSLTMLGREFEWLEIGDSSAGRFCNSAFLQTGHFWSACALLRGARAVVTHEGALHHAAAALGTPCVVIRGGFISPRVTGYAGQVDLYVEDERWPLGCGMRIYCQHCVDAMKSITPAAVLAALKDLLARNAKEAA